MKRLEKIYSDIRNVKVQGATNVAKAALTAYMIRKDNSNKKKLLSLRPTEPMLSNALNFSDIWPEERVIKHFGDTQNKINYYVSRIIKNNYKIFTHCHSTNVIKALINAKNRGKKFEIFNTETRPLYQGRKTARELSKEGIKVTTFVDSGMREAIKECDIVFLGADAILEKGIINKIGSGAIADIAKILKKPVYIVADSWKFSPRNVKIEERDFHEIWKRASRKIKIRNPAFEFVEKNKIEAIISEHGILPPSKFVKIAKKELNF